MYMRASGAWIGLPCNRKMGFRLGTTEQGQGDTPEASAQEKKSEQPAIASADLAELRKIVRELERENRTLGMDLAKARSRPFKSLRSLLMHRLLRGLSSSKTLPHTMTTRFRRSAAKRDPLRSLPEEVSEPTNAGDLTVNVDLNANGKACLTPNPAKKTVMVVTHQASRTGAPILALNIAQKLAEKYNVVTVTMDGGDILEDFKATSVAVYDLGSYAKIRISYAVKKICRAHDLLFALVNSVESRAAFPGLKAAGVPSVALLHEFASYTRPRSAFADVLKDADQVVFSTRITLENALEQYGIERSTALHVLPQGKCIVPGGDMNAHKSEEERQWLDSIMRPTGDNEREFVVLGAGTIELRKAVDLFLETATRVIGAPGGGRFRFVWIGGRYDPEKDMVTSAYVADQIRRAGLQDQVAIVPPTSEIEYAYRVADVLLLSSRLDPLPNVAIDALIAGTPVLCFERTTGIADFLLESDLGEACVAPYLNAGAMAQKIVALADDPALLSQVSEQSKTAAHERFNLDRYIETLDAIGCNIVPTDTQIAQDAEYLAESGAFRSDFFCGPDKDKGATPEVLRAYLRANHSGQGMRKPAPGFLPGAYAVAHERRGGSDPFVQYLREGRPEGVWTLPVIDETAEVDVAAVAGLKQALHLHVTAPEALPALAARLSANAVRPDLFLSTTEGHEEAVRAASEHLPYAVKTIETVPARGRDFGALLTGFGPVLVQEYDVIGHLSVDGGRNAETDTFVLANLLGDETHGPMIDRTLTAMARDGETAIVFPDDPEVSNWGESRPAADRLARHLGLGRLPDQIYYPTQNAFWMRRAVLERFLALGLDWSDYPAGRHAPDATILAALPRLVGVVPRLDGQQVAVTNLRGVTR